MYLIKGKLLRYRKRKKGLHPAEIKPTTFWVCALEASALPLSYNRWRNRCPRHPHSTLSELQIFEEDERDFLPRKRRFEEYEEAEKDAASDKKKKKKKKKKKRDNDEEEESDDEDEDEEAEASRKLEEAKREEQRRRRQEEEERREKEKEKENPFLKPVRMPRLPLLAAATPLKKEKWLLVDWRALFFVTFPSGTQ